MCWDLADIMRFYLLKDTFKFFKVFLKSDLKMNNALNEFQDIINIRFKIIDFLILALTHKSYGFATGNNEWNDRLEFLGDSILSSVVSDYLYHRFPDADEMILSRIKSHLVSRDTLAKWAKKIDIGKYIYLSTSEEATGGRAKEKIIADAYEALLGAIYLEKGFLIAKKFVNKNLDSENFLSYTDYKSQLQEAIQKKI